MSTTNGSQAPSKANQTVVPLPGSPEKEWRNYFGSSERRRGEAMARLGRPSEVIEDVRRRRRNID